MGAPNQLSFLPDDYLERKARRRANILCGVLAVVVLGTIGTAFTMSERATLAVEKRHTQVEQEYADAARRIEQVNRMRAQQEQVVRRAELAASLVEKVPRSNILAEYTNSLPAGLSLLDLALESRERSPSAAVAVSAFDQKTAALRGAAPPPSVKSYDVYLKVTGIASNDVQVAQFITKLNRSKLFKEVNLVISDTFTQRTETLRRFQIEMMLNPAAEVTAPAEDANKKTSAVALESTAKPATTAPASPDEGTTAAADPGEAAK
jgi:Tfp pilus assembly protein PilN